MLKENRTYYVRTDGNDKNSGLTDEAVGAFKTWQRAVQIVAALDLAGQTVTLQHGEEYPQTFTSTVVIPPMTGGGRLLVRGAPTPGATTFNVPGQCFQLESPGCKVQFENMTLIGGGSGQIYVAYNSAAYIHHGMVFGPCNFAHIYVHDSQAMALVLGASYIVNGGGGYHLFNNAGMVFMEASSIVLKERPHFAGGFVEMRNGAKMQTVSTMFPGASTGPRYQVRTNGVIDTAGGGPDYFPGSSPGAVSSGGQYV